MTTLARALLGLARTSCMKSASSKLSMALRMCAYCTRKVRTSRAIFTVWSMFRFLKVWWAQRLASLAESFVQLSRECGNSYALPHGRATAPILFRQLIGNFVCVKDLTQNLAHGPHVD